MKFKTIKPSRRTLLSLAVMVTLAPAGVGLRQMLAPEEGRTAATIADLDEDYECFLWSNKDTDFQNEPGLLVVTSKTRTRFTGTLKIGEGEPQEIPVNGGVSSSGRVALNGSLNSGNFRVRINVTGQLSADGSAIVGTYNAIGRTDEGPLNDRGGIVFVPNNETD